MAITMMRLCEDAKAKYNMVLVAGKGGIENTVRWVHMVEDREVPDFLHGGELIFTTGIGHIEDEAKMLEFTRNLHKHNAAGVVFNIGPYIRSIPQDVIQFADENDFPVFTLPWKVHIIDISYDFCNMIIENEKAEMSLMQAFKNLIFSPENAGDYLPALQKNGFSASSEYRVMAICFYNQKGKVVTSPMYSKNKIMMWKLFARSDSPAAIIEQASKLLIIKQNCTEMQVKRILNSVAKAFESSRIDYRIGVSETGTGCLSVPELYRQANAAFITAEYEKVKSRSYSEIGLNRLILAVDNKSVLEGYAKGVLKSVLEYDEKNNAGLTGLLRLYIENDCSVISVAQISGVHRNTINNRIKQIRELLGGDLTEKRKAELILAFQIIDILEFI